MTTADLLDRAIRGEPPATPEIEALAALASDLEAMWTVTPSAEAGGRGWGMAMRAFRAAETPPGGRLRRTVARAVVAAAAVVALPAAAWGAAADTLPGDALYPVKHAFERARLALSGDDSAVHLDLASARLEEAVLAEAEGREDVVVESLRAYVAEVAAAGGALQDSEDVLAHHQEVLTALLAVVPEEAVPGIERALEASSRAMGQPALGPEGAPGQDLPGRGDERQGDGQGAGGRGGGKPEDHGPGEKGGGSKATDEDKGKDVTPPSPGSGGDGALDGGGSQQPVEVETPDVTEPADGPAQGKAPGHAK